MAAKKSKPTKPAKVAKTTEPSKDPHRAIAGRIDLSFYFIVSGDDERECHVPGFGLGDETEDAGLIKRMANAAIGAVRDEDLAVGNIGAISYTNYGFELFSVERVAKFFDKKTRSQKSREHAHYLARVVGWFDKQHVREERVSTEGERET